MGDEKMAEKRRAEKEEEVARRRDEILEKIRWVFVRACVHHMPQKIGIHLAWSAFEEKQGDIDKASEILEKIERFHPQLLSVMLKRINLERRRGNVSQVHKLFTSCIDAATNAGSKALASELTVKYARFLRLASNDTEAALEVLAEAIVRDPLNGKLYLQLLDIHLHAAPLDHDKVMSVFESALKVEGWTAKQRLVFLQRKLDYLEDFGDSIVQVSQAQAQVSKLRVEIKDAASKAAEASGKDRRKNEKDVSVITTTNSLKQSSKSAINGGIGGSGSTPTSSSTTTTYSATNSASYGAQHASQYQQYGSRYSGAPQYPSSYNQYGSYYQGYYPQ